MGVAVRLLLPELLAARGWSVYRLIREAGARPVNGRLVGGRLDASWVYRVARSGGYFASLSPARLEALCDALGCAPRDLFPAGDTPRQHQ